MEYQSYIIRAAALERLINSIVPMFEREVDLSSKFEGLSELKSFYPNSGGIVAYFPTGNTGVLVKIIMTIIRIYQVFPEINEKIDVLYCFTKILSKSNEAKIKRGKEIKELSEWLNKISQELNGKTYNITIDFIKKTDHEFHPDSEFVSCRFVITDNV